MEIEEVKNIIKSLLFVSSEPLSLKQFIEILKDIQPEKITLALEELKKEDISFLKVTETIKGYQLCTKKEYVFWIRKLFQQKIRHALSQPALETLAIIAYKQPIIRVEIEKIRGVNVDGVIQTLIEKKLIKVVGRKKIIGHPFLYGTTQEFLSYFGLKDLSELPKPEENFVTNNLV